MSVTHVIRLSAGGRAVHPPRRCSRQLRARGLRGALVRGRSHRARRPHAARRQTGATRAMSGLCPALGQR